MSTFKNFITGGNFGKLEDEKEDFEILKDKFLKFQDEYVAINQERLNALLFLQEERAEVVRNLSMAKNLISKVKIIRNNEIQEFKTDAITYFENKNIEFEDGTVMVNFQGHLDSVSETFIISLDDSFKRLAKNKTYTKANLKEEAALVALETLIGGVTALFTLNSEINENRKKIVKATTQIRNEMPKMTKQAAIVFAEVKRIIEIATVLNKHNEVFSKKYCEVYRSMNSRSKTLLFFDELLGRKIEPDYKMQNDIHQIRMLSSEYSKFNKDASM